MAFWSRQSNDTERRHREFEALALPLRREIYNGALRMTGSPDEAEDLAQDVFVRAYAAFHQFQQGTNFRAWVFRILTNTYINQYRKRARSPQTLELDAMTPEMQYQASPQAALQDDDPEEIVLEAIPDAAIQNALQHLPDEFRIVVLLYDVHQFSYQEIARQLEIPVGTVRSRLSRGRSQLRHALQDYAKERRLV